VLASGLFIWALAQKSKADALVISEGKAKSEALQAAEKADWATQAAQGARASALAEVPGRATEALVLAIKLVAPNVMKNRPVPPQAFHGLVDSMLAVGYLIPEQHTLLGHTGAVNSVAFSPDGTRIITAGDDHTTRLWDSDNLELIRTYER